MGLCCASPRSSKFDRCGRLAALIQTCLNPHSMVGCVPPGIPQPSVHAPLYNSEDDEAVLRMINKGRPHLRHVSRTHRINSDWLHERINWYTTISIRTKCFWCPQITAVPCARKERNAPWSHAAVADSWRTNRFAKGWCIIVATNKLPRVTSGVVKMKKVSKTKIGACTLRLSKGSPKRRTYDTNP